MQFYSWPVTYCIGNEQMWVFINNFKINHSNIVFTPFSEYINTIIGNLYEINWAFSFAVVL